MSRARWITAVLAFALALTISAQTAQGPEALFGAAMHQEQVTGDLKAAIAGYQKVLAAKGVSRTLAARAQYQIGVCYARLGNQEARKAFEAVVRGFADQKDLVAQARARLAAMGSGGGAVSLRQLKVDEQQGCHGWNVSLDGRLLGAVEYLTGNMAVIDAATGECRALTNWGKWDRKNGFVDQGAISRDGKWLASWHYGGTNDGEIRVVGTDGKGERTVYVRRKSAEWHEWGIPSDWSPDGRTIVVQFEHGTQRSTQHGTAELALISLADGSVRVLKSLQYASRHRPKILFSPDGKYLAWDYPIRFGSMDTDLFVMPAAGGPEIRVASNPAKDTLVSWTASGDLLFLSDRSGRSSLHLAKMSRGRETGEPAEIRPNVLEAMPVGLTNSGTFYYTEPIVRADAYQADVDPATGALASPAKLVSERMMRSASGAVWSGDGQWLVIRRTGAGGNGTPFVVRSSSGGMEREIVASIKLASWVRLRLSRDGSFLTTSGTSTQGIGVHRVDMSTGEVKLIASGLDILDWSDDGRLMVRIGGPNRQHMIVEDVQTGLSRTVFQGEKALRAFSLSPDGKRIAFVGQWDETPAPLLVLDLETGNTREVDQGFYSHIPSQIAWTMNGRNLIAVRARKKPENPEDFALAVIPLEGGSVREINIPFRKEMITNIAAHPNGKTITWSHWGRDTQWWAMDNFLPLK